VRILLLTFYYPPDIGPGPLRAESLVTALQAQGRDDLVIEVLTTMPNRYQAIATDAPEEQQIGSVRVGRIRLPSHRSGMKDQSMAFGAFAMEVLRRTRGHRWDLVISTSSRLMTQALATVVARRSGARLFLDVRDLFTETIDQVLDHPLFRVALPAFRQVERWTYRQAAGVNVVSPAFVSHVETLRPGRPVRVFTNGIDDVFLRTDFTAPPSPEPPLVVYAGNLGDGQGVHRVLPRVAAEWVGRARFRLVGDGGRRPELAHATTEAGLPNVEILDPVPRARLMEQYREARVLFLHLNDLAAFRKVLPSKIFEYAATGKPILAGVGGFAAEFLRAEVPGVEVFAPCDVAGMSAALDRLLQGPTRIDRTDFCRRYRRDEVMRGLAESVLHTAEER
jgi:glycosyltransferase involved in cell wall biosynthesis